MSRFRPLALALAVSSCVAALSGAYAGSIIRLEAPNGLATAAITSAPGGGFALAAQELVPYDGGTDPRIHIFRYEADGSKRWVRVIDRSGPQLAKAITYGAGEILYIAGLDGSHLSANGYQSMLTAYGPNGEVVTDALIGDPYPSEEFFSGISVTAGGDLLVSGRQLATIEGTADMQVQQLTRDGTPVWSVKEKLAAKESYPIIISAGATNYVAGTFENKRVFVSRIENGSLSKFASFSMERRCGVAQGTALSDGGMVLGINMTGGENGARLVRVSGSGEVTWNVKVPGNSTIADITQLENGTLVVVGTRDDPKALTAQAWLKAYDLAGNEIGEILPEDQGQTRAGGVTIDGQGGVYFAYSPVDESIPAKPVPVIVERIRIN